MYQTSSEKIYVSGLNSQGELGTQNTNAVATPIQTSVFGKNAFGMGAGYNNTYIIENTGNVYASGENTYGSIGNGTRTAIQEHTLVGNRIFEIEQASKTMREGDQELIDVIGSPFNVFSEQEISADEFIWESKNVPEDSEDKAVEVKIENGKATLIAKHEGTANIYVTDKVTGSKICITRIVLPQDKDRIEKITVNDIPAELSEDSSEDDLIYKVAVVTNENTGTLKIETTNKTDAISIDGGVTWSYNGDFSKTVNLPDKITEFEITIGIRNNEGEYPEETRQTYKLFVEKISDDVGIKKLSVTSKDKNGNEIEINATPVSLTKYEVVVSEETDISRIYGLANNEYSWVSLDGQEYKVKENNTNISMDGELTKEVKIVVKSEAGREAEYTLVIYKESAALELISVTANDKEASKATNGEYAVTVPYNTEKVNVKAIVSNDIAYVGIDGGTYQLKTNSKEIKITEEITKVIIRTKINDNTIKEYTLTIQRLKEEQEQNGPAIDMVFVNGKLIAPEKDGVTYIAYLPSTVTDAEIRGVAKENNINVKIAEYEAEKGDSRRTVLVTDYEADNTHRILLSDDEGNETQYTVIIRKAGTDTSLNELYAEDGDTLYEPEKIDETNYTLKVPGNVEKLDVTAITGYANSKVQVSDTGNYKIHKDTQKVLLTGDETIVKIKVKSEDETVETEYILSITRMSNNVNLLKVSVDGEDATYEDDGNYHYTLKTAKTNVIVFAETEEKAPKETYVNVGNTGYNLYNSMAPVDIDANEIRVPIKVKAEDGTMANYTLIIEGLPDDVNIETVIVNEKQATYNFEKSRYEVRCKEDEYDVTVTLSDMLATMKLGTNPEAQGVDSITVSKDTSRDETIVKVTVTSQSGLVTEDYIIAIMEQSTNSNIDTIVVNGETVSQNDAGEYYIGLAHTTKTIDIVATAEDILAITKIDNDDNNSHIATKTENVISPKTMYEYEIVVIAENGTEQKYKLIVEILEANYDIIDVLVRRSRRQFRTGRVKR